MNLGDCQGHSFPKRSFRCSRTEASCAEISLNCRLSKNKAFYFMIYNRNKITALLSDQSGFSFGFRVNYSWAFASTVILGSEPYFSVNRTSLPSLIPVRKASHFLAVLNTQALSHVHTPLIPLLDIGLLIISHRIKF
jgi:hypothetical protein